MAENSTSCPVSVPRYAGMRESVSPAVGAASSGLSVAGRLHTGGTLATSGGTGTSTGTGTGTGTSTSTGFIWFLYETTPPHSHTSRLPHFHTFARSQNRHQQPDSGTLARHRRHASRVEAWARASRPPRGALLCVYSSARRRSSVRRRKARSALL